MGDIITIRFSKKNYRDKFLKDVIHNIKKHRRSDIIKEILFKVFVKMYNEQTQEAMKILNNKEKVVATDTRKSKSVEDFIF